MSRLSNKGQSLAIFIVFIPLFIMMGTFVVDMAYARYNSNKLNETNKMVIRYGLKHIEENPFDDMVHLIYQNDSEIDNYDIKIDVLNKTVSVSIDKASRGFFGSLIGKDIYKEKSSYIGYIKDEKIIIDEVK